jgi:hypothetical protein
LGLFATVDIMPGWDICLYEGEVVSHADLMQESYDTTYVFWIKGEGGESTNYYVDAAEAYESYGRYINDPLEDDRVNAKVVVRYTEEGDAYLQVVAANSIEMIAAGDEIFISSGRDYWMHRLALLPCRLRAAVLEEYDST